MNISALCRLLLIEALAAAMLCGRDSGRGAIKLSERLAYRGT
jgi:hypothetical protein